MMWFNFIKHMSSKMEMPHNFYHLPNRQGNTVIAESGVANSVYGPTKKHIWQSNMALVSKWNGEHKLRQQAFTVY